LFFIVFFSVRVGLNIGSVGWVGSGQSFGGLGWVDENRPTDNSELASVALATDIVVDLPTYWLKGL